VGANLAPGGGAGAEVYVAPRNYVLGAAAMLIAAALVMASVVIAIAALPRIGRELLASQTQLQWIVDITPTALASFVLPAGSLLDRYGRKAGLTVGFLILGAALTWSGFVSSPEELIAARLLTGVGAAIVFPGTLTVLRAITPPERRTRAVGYWSASTLAGGTVGFLIAGGLLETSLWWGSFFVFTALIALFCLVATLIAVPETRDPDPPRLDPIGALLALLGMGGVVLGTVEIPVRALLDPLVLGAYAVGFAALAGFVAWEARVQAPMLDVRLFRHPGFAGGFLAIVMLFAGSYGWFTLAFQYSGYVLGYSVLGAGLAMVPNALSTLPLAVLSPRMSARWGWRSTTTFSLAFLSFGAAVLAAVGHARAFWPMAAGFFVFGIGLGSGTTAPTQALVDALPAAKQGVASAVNDAAREVGAAIGIAVVGSVFNAAYRTHVASDRSLHAVSGLVAAIRASPAVGLQLAGRLPPAQAATVREAVAGGAVNGWVSAFIVMAVALMFAAGLIWFGMRGRAETVHVGRAPAPAARLPTRAAVQPAPAARLPTRAAVQPAEAPAMLEAPATQRAPGATGPRARRPPSWPIVAVALFLLTLLLARRRGR
jgi:MFS family permease